MAIALFAACTGPASTFCPPLDSADAVPLDAGYHPISPFFGYEVQGGFWSGRSIFVWHVADPEKPRELLAFVRVGYLGDTYYRPALFAVSDDGKTLLYRHDAGDSAPKAIESKPPGLYECTHGSGERLIHANVGVVQARPLPRDAIVFWVPDPDGGVDADYVRTTSGDEYPLEVHGGNALHRAAYLGETEEVLRLLRSGVAIEATDARGFTPLLEGIWAGRLGAVEALLDNGASLDAVTPSPEWTPLDVAARFGHVDIVDALLEKGVDVNARNAAGKTAYELAVQYKQPETAARLLERGALPTPSTGAK